MWAARWHGRQDVRLEQVPDPASPGAGWVTVGVTACGLCGTDVEEYVAGPVVISTSPNGRTGVGVPVVLGHEVVGVVTAAGDGVSLHVGTRVAVETTLACGTCAWCRRGETQLCAVGATLGLTGDGGLAELMAAPAASCAPLADEVDDATGVLAEPLSVAVRAVRRAGLRPGESALVMGAGTVGLLVLEVLRHRGAGPVVVTDTLENRRALALTHGAAAAVPPADAARAVHELTHGAGVDLALEAAGRPSAVVEALDLVRRGGRVVMLGVFDADVPVPARAFVLQEKSLLTSLSHVYDDDFRAAVDMVNAGAVSVAGIVTDRIRLLDVVRSGLEPLVRQPDQHLKIIVTG